MSIIKGDIFLDSSKKKLIFEFLRYAVVGGISAVVDLAVNYLFLFWIFKTRPKKSLNGNKTKTEISIITEFFMI